ncbi:MAG: LapA family protein [Gammaproteobacteria bacterium]|nr:LapA family protein [Gammaproteobacteria bacterium]
MIRLLLRMFYLLLFLGALLVTVIWGRRNAQPVTLDYYWGQAEMPLAAVFLGGLIVGALLSMLVGGLTVAALRLQNWRLSRQLARRPELPGEPPSGAAAATPPGAPPGAASKVIPGAVPGMAPGAPVGAAPAAWRRFAPVSDKES